MPNKWKTSSMNHENISSNKTIFLKWCPKGSLNSTIQNVKSISPVIFPPRADCSWMFSSTMKAITVIPGCWTSTRVQGAPPFPGPSHLKTQPGLIDSSLAAGTPVTTPWHHLNTGPHFRYSAPVFLLTDLLTPVFAVSNFCRLPEMTLPTGE